MPDTPAPAETRSVNSFRASLFIGLSVAWRGEKKGGWGVYPEHLRMFCVVIVNLLVAEFDCPEVTLIVPR